MKIACGEMQSHSDEFIPMIQQGLVDVVQPDVHT